MTRQGMQDLIRKKVDNIRHWELTTLGEMYPNWGFEFTVMTYNILSQAALECHLYLYRNCNPQFIREEYRILRILSEILESESDVVCLQDVEQDVYQRIEKVFDSKGFGSIFKKRTGNKSDGCAILWRRAKFSLLRHQEIEYRIKGSEYLNRDDVGLIAVLRLQHPQGSHTQLHIATTHLIFNPQRGDVKLCQLRLLLAELERSAFRGVGENGRVYHPTVLCGDFNFEPHSPLYKFVESGRLDVNGLVSGNLSGQHEGRNKGGPLDGDKLAMKGIGINASGRFVSKGGFFSKRRRANGSDKCQTELSSDGCRRNEEFSFSSDSWPGLYRMSKDIMPSMQSKNNTTSRKMSSSAERNLSSSESAHAAGTFYHDFNFVSAYKYYHGDRRICPISSMINNDCFTVDHIFYNVMRENTSSYEEGSLKLFGTYSLPLAEDLKDIDDLPNAYLGSDHLSLMSKFSISFEQ